MRLAIKPYENLTSGTAAIEIGVEASKLARHLLELCLLASVAELRNMVLDDRPLVLAFHLLVLDRAYSLQPLSYLGHLNSALISFLM